MPCPVGDVDRAVPVHAGERGPRDRQSLDAAGNDAGDRTRRDLAVVGGHLGVTVDPAAEQRSGGAGQLDGDLRQPHDARAATRDGAVFEPRSRPERDGAVLEPVEDRAVRSEPTDRHPVGDMGGAEIRRLTELHDLAAAGALKCAGQLDRFGAGRREQLDRRRRRRVELDPVDGGGDL